MADTVPVSPLPQPSYKILDLDLTSENVGHQLLAREKLLQHNDTVSLNWLQINTFAFLLLFPDFFLCFCFGCLLRTKLFIPERIIGSFCKGTGTSLDSGVHSTNTQMQSNKKRIQTFFICHHRVFPSCCSISLILPLMKTVTWEAFLVGGYCLWVWAVALLCT